jgi:hypothetical protein
MDKPLIAKMVASPVSAGGADKGQLRWMPGRENPEPLLPSADSKRRLYSALGWLAVLTVALIVRAVVYSRVEYVLHSDEAIHGLLARHILGGEIQLFVYGLPYGGTLHDHWTALLFALFGQSTFVLKWAAGLETLALIAAVYLLGREMAGGDRRVGWLAAILVAVGPLYLIEWSLRPRGGYVQIATFSALALWMTLKALRFAPIGKTLEPMDRKAARRWLVAAAFVLGLSWWSQFMTIYAILTCLILFLWKGGPLRSDRRIWGAGAAAFLIGSAPFWAYNVRYPAASFRMILERGSGASSVWAGVAQRFTGMFREAIPILLGARQTDALGSFGAVFVWMVVLAYLSLLGAALLRRPAEFRRHSTGAFAGLLFLSIAAAFYILTAFAWYSREPRYLLPIYGVLPALAATGALALWDRGSAMRWAGVGAIAGILLLSVYGYAKADRSVIQPWTTEQQVPEDLSPLKAFLDAHDVTRVFTNFYVGYRLAFETQERIVACTDDDPIPELYTPYCRMVREAGPRAGFVMGPRSARWLTSILDSNGITYRTHTVQGFNIFYDLSAPFNYYPAGPRYLLPGDIAVERYDSRCKPGQRVPVEITVRNQGLVTWHIEATQWPNVLVSYHLLDPNTEKMLQFDNPRFRLPRDLGRGESARMVLTVDAPTTVGPVAFVPDLVIEGELWFSDLDPGLLRRKHWRGLSMEAASPTKP